MIGTLVGYSGGSTAAPTYHDIGDHAETIRIAYDPARISYAELLDLFWQNHNPVAPSWRRQYMSAIFFNDTEQQGQAIASKEARERRTGTKLYTEIVPAGPFYRAEDYHQKHTLRRHRELFNELKTRFSSEQAFQESTIAARLNGYLAGYGACDRVQKDMVSLGLSVEGQREVLRAACGVAANASCPLPERAPSSD